MTLTEIFFIFFWKAVLTQSREQVSEELVRLQKDNESLQGKHSLHVSLQQAENFILPEAAEVKYFEIINTNNAQNLMALEEASLSTSCLKTAH